MKQINYSILIICYIILISCNKKDNINNNDSNSNDSIIKIIFKKRSYTRDTIKLNLNQLSWNISKLNYSIEGSPIENELLPNNIKGDDTIIIKTKKDIILSHPYYYYFRTLYKFKPNDIVVFNYPKDAPICTLSNRNEKNIGLNFNTLFDLKTELAKNPKKYYLANTSASKEIEYINKIKKEKQQKIEILFNQKKISLEYYELLISQFNTKRLFLNENINLSNSNYRINICNYIYKKYNIQDVKSRKGFGKTKDFRALFDSISIDSNISKKNKDYLLYNSLQFIADEFLAQDFELYNKKFNLIVKDTMLINNINNKYLLNFSKLKNETKEVYLCTSTKKKLSLNDFLLKNKGYVIYVDFWASWCLPCREEMFFSKKLNEKYKNKKIKFIYISIDSNFDNWVRASTKEGLWNYNYNFLTMNYLKADFYKTLNINLIPRYLIYDKFGKLVNSDAPRPSSEFVNKELDKYLN
jgi:thiol-disulfide isomerase/thioredoxin